MARLGIGMSRRGNNLADFRETQLEFAAHIRNPAINQLPNGVEARRMRIYRDLFYNNIESFLASGFPIAKKVLGDTLWHGLVNDFVYRHPSESPYFLEISQEFLTYLNRLKRTDLPGFLLELCHYEWVELALSVSAVELPGSGFDSNGNLLDSQVQVSPLIWCLAYRYPVHQIGPEFQPSTPPATGVTHLIVYRRDDDSVHFMVSNALTLRLIELLQAHHTGDRALQLLAEEIPTVNVARVSAEGVATLQQLLDAGILLGSVVDT